MRFSELGKDAAAMRRKFERDVAVLAKHVQANPTVPRWHYYLGASLHDLLRYEEAIEAYRACAALRGWEEEGAWACYRAADCYCSLKRWREAIDMCAQGLAIRPATAELAWLAGYAAFNARRYEDAIAWSNMAVVNGFYDGAGAGFARISFRNATRAVRGAVRGAALDVRPARQPRGRQGGRARGRRRKEGSGGEIGDILRGRGHRRRGRSLRGEWSPLETVPYSM